MIDNFSLMFFSALIVYVVLKAVKLDKMLPWFTDEQAELPEGPSNKLSDNKNPKKTEKLEKS